MFPRFFIKMIFEALKPSFCSSGVSGVKWLNGLVAQLQSAVHLLVTKTRLTIFEWKKLQQLQKKAKNSDTELFLVIDIVYYTVNLQLLNC